MKILNYAREDHFELLPICYRLMTNEELHSWVLVCVDRFYDMVVTQDLSFFSSRKKSGLNKALKYYEKNNVFHWKENEKYMKARNHANARKSRGVYYKLVNQNSN